MSTPHFSILKSVQYDPQFFKKYSHSICDIDFIEKWIWIIWFFCHFSIERQLPIDHKKKVENYKI